MKKSMIIFRPQRGSLSDSMSESQIFYAEDPVESMKRYIVNKFSEPFGIPLFSIDDIVLGDNTIDDPRTKWQDTRYVCVKRYAGTIFDTPQCIGMCATKWG